MKKGEIIGIVAIMILVLGFIYMYAPEEEVLFAPPIPSILGDCSDASIQALWDVIFDESSAGASIVTNTSSTEYCEYYYAWKIVGNLTYVLTGYSSVEYLPEGENSKLLYRNSTFLFAVQGNSTDEVNETFLDLNESEVGENYGLAMYVFLSSGPEILARKRTEVVKPGLEFESIFNFENETAFQYAEPYYYFDYSASSEDEEGYHSILTQEQGSGAVYDENQTSFYMASEFIDVSCEPSWICGAWSECVNDARTRICLDAKNCGNNYEKPAEVDSCPDCVPNWTAHNTACNAITETYVIWYSDEEQCENVTVRGNDTVYCDPDGNGIIGKVHEIDDDNFDVIVYIDNDEINYSTNYTLLGEEKVEFVDEDTDLVRIEFDYDFEEEEALNLKIIHVEVQDDNDDFGYILIEGLEDIDKEVRVERILDSGIVCVEDRAIDDIDDIDEDCDGSREYIVQCPGENSNQDIECDVSSGVYIISGLEHSGVREIDGWTNPVCGSGHLNLCTTQTSCTNVGGYWYTNGCHSSQDCAASWTCNWGSCINGQRTKTCTDENNCESDTTETEACTAGCTPSWSCGAWDPLDDECSNEEEQTRTCTDLNNCGTLSGKPVETKSCEAGGLNLWLISLIAGISVLVIVIIVVLFKVLRNRSEDLVQEQPRIQVAQRQPRGFHQGMHYGGPGGPGSPGGGGAGGYRR